MGENLDTVSSARINDLVYKLNGKYDNEAARKLIIIGKNPKTKQQLTTILQEKRKEFAKDKELSENCDISLISGQSCFPSYIKAIDRVLSEL